MKFLLTASAFLLAGVLAAGGITLNPTGPERPLVSSGTGTKTITVNVSGELDGVRLRAEIMEYGSKKAVAKVSPVKAQKETKLTFQLKKIGFYEIILIADRENSELARRETTYSVVPTPDYDRPKEMGTCTHFAFGGKSVRGHFPYTFELLKLAGFTRIRDDLFWSAIEERPGIYKIPERMEKLADALPAYGIRPLFVTGYNNGKAYPGKFKKGFPTTQEMFDAYAKAVAFAVKHFGDRVTEWEIWNEPNSAHPVKEYLPLLKTVYPAIKAANPNAQVISCGGGGAGGGPGGAMIIPIAGAGGLDFMDAFSIHPYMSPGFDPDFGYAAGGSPIPRVSVPHFTTHLYKNFAQKRTLPNGKHPGFYVTEVGWYVQHPGEGQATCTELIQAAYFARLYLLNRAQTNGDVPVYWYDFQNDGINRAEREDNFGLIRQDYSPKPAYQAAAVTAYVLRNRPFTKAITKDVVVTPEEKGKDLLRSGILKLYVYGRDNDAFLAAWTAQGDPQVWNRKCKAVFPLPFPYENAKLIDWSGRELPMPKKLDGNRIELNVTFMPQYIIQK